MHVAIRTRQGCTTVLQPTTGGAQGDKVMPVQFRRAYEDKLEQWNKHKESDLDSGILGLDPYTNDKVDVSTTCYADDVK